MAKTKISEYDSTANNNTDVASVNIDEGCAPSGINNAIRAVMAHLKDYQQGTNGDSFNGPHNGTVGATTPAAGTFTTLATTGNTTLGNDSGDVITINGSTSFGAGAGITGNLTLSSGTANGVAYLNGSKVLTTGSGLVFDGTNLGLGVTPSAWNSGVKALQINRLGFQGNGSSGGVIAANAYYGASAWTYINSDYATSYEQSSGQHKWFTAPSGTAGNTFSFTQAMTLDSLGRLGVGTTNPLARIVASNAGAEGLELSPVAGYISGAYIQAYNRSTSSYMPLEFNATTIAFYNNANERARIDSSGNLLVGTSSSTNGKITVLKNSLYNSHSNHGLVLLSNDNNAYTSMYMGADDTSNIGYIQTAQHNTGYARDLAINPNGGNLLVGTTSAGGQGGLTVYPNGSGTSVQLAFKKAADGVQNTAQVFFAGSTQVGAITYTNTATAYNTSSDYRLKENVQPMTGALAKVAALRPVTYTWKADGSEGEGFIAHELAEVCPAAVTGEKDAVDADGKPQYQGIDVSFLVGTLTAALQEAHGLIKNLQARVDALESK